MIHRASTRPEIERAVREGVTALESLTPTRSVKRAKAGPAEPMVHEGKRKAIKAALSAGVKPGQVAKHFGLPLTAIRRVLSEAG